MKLLIVGLGSIGQRHLRNLRSLGSFEYVALRFRNHPLPEEFGDLSIRTVSRLEDAVAEQPDITFLCAPPAVQQQVMHPLVHGTRSHFFVEKPGGLDLATLTDCARTLRGTGRQSLMGYNLRLHPVTAVVRSVLAAGTLGRVTSARASVGQYLPDWHPYEDYRQGYSANRRLGGGVILDLIHEIDLLYSWFGRPDTVKAIAGRSSALEIDTEDTAEIVCQFANRVIGSLHLDYVQRVPLRQGLIVGDAGSLTYDLLKNECHVLRPGVPVETHAFPDFVRNDMYRNEVALLLESIRTGVPCAPDLGHGADVLALALAARQDAGLPDPGGQ